MKILCVLILICIFYSVACWEHNWCLEGAGFSQPCFDKNGKIVGESCYCGEFPTAVSRCSDSSPCIARNGTLLGESSECFKKCDCSCFPNTVSDNWDSWQHYTVLSLVKRVAQLEQKVDMLTARVAVDNEQVYI